MAPGMSALQGIVCDGPGCGRPIIQVTKTQPAAGPARKRAGAEGWHVARGTYQSTSGPRGYSRDICPKCWAEGVR